MTLHIAYYHFAMCNSNSSSSSSVSCVNTIFITILAVNMWYYYLFQQAYLVCLMLSVHVGVQAVHSDLWLWGLTVYIYSLMTWEWHPLGWTRRGVRGREGHGLQRTHTHAYTNTHIECFIFGIHVYFDNKMLTLTCCVTLLFCHVYPIFWPFLCQLSAFGCLNYFTFPLTSHTWKPGKKTYAQRTCAHISKSLDYENILLKLQSVTLYMFILQEMMPHPVVL